MSSAASLYCILIVVVDDDDVPVYNYKAVKLRQTDRQRKRKETAGVENEGRKNPGSSYILIHKHSSLCAFDLPQITVVTPAASKLLMTPMES